MTREKVSFFAKTKTANLHWPSSHKLYEKETFTVRFPDAKDALFLATFGDEVGTSEAEQH